MRDANRKKLEETFDADFRDARSNSLRIINSAHNRAYRARCILTLRTLPMQCAKTTVFVERNARCRLRALRSVQHDCAQQIARD